MAQPHRASTTPRAHRVRPLAVLLVIASIALALAGCSSDDPATTSGGSMTLSTSSVSASAKDAPDDAGTSYEYYLSVGDSLAFGYQESKFIQELKAHTYTPASFDTGYTDLVLEALEAANPTIASANLGCPGETTSTYLRGGCPTTRGGESLHAKYTGSQDAAAVAFLEKHTGRGLITLALGANDLNDAIASCPELAVSCVEPKLPAVFSQVRTNLTEVVAHLHAAAPDARIVVLELYNPYAVDIPPPTSSRRRSISRSPRQRRRPAPPWRTPSLSSTAAEPTRKPPCAG